MLIKETVTLTLPSAAHSLGQRSHTRYLSSQWNYGRYVWQEISDEVLGVLSSSTNSIHNKLCDLVKSLHLSYS